MALDFEFEIEREMTSDWNEDDVEEERQVSYLQLRRNGSRGLGSAGGEVATSTDLS